MSNAYIYFAATLPHLEFDSDSPMTNDDYLGECERLLTKDDYALAHRVMTGDRGGPDIPDETITAIDRTNRDFINELVWVRTLRSHRESGDAAKKDRAGSVTIIEAVQQASKETNLLEAERSLDRARWRAWDEVLMGQTSGLAYIIVYGLKLMIVNRYRAINSPRGREIFEGIKKVEMPV